MGRPSNLSEGPVIDPRGVYDDLSVTEHRTTMELEETDLEVTPVRPHAVDEFAFENERTGDTVGSAAMHFEGTVKTTAVDDGLGLENEEITDAR